MTFWPLNWSPLKFQLVELDLSVIEMLPKKLGISAPLTKKDIISTRVLYKCFASFENGVNYLEDIPFTEIDHKDHKIRFWDLQGIFQSVMLPNNHKGLRSFGVMVIIN